jgi:hypothetical protein
MALFKSQQQSSLWSHSSTPVQVWGWPCPKIVHLGEGSFPYSGKLVAESLHSYYLISPFDFARLLTVLIVIFSMKSLSFVFCQLASSGSILWALDHLLPDPSSMQISHNP